MARPDRPPGANADGWKAYLGAATKGGPDIPAPAAAARATDLVGLPPTLISVGFSDEDVQYAVELRHAGVPVDLYVYAGDEASRTSMLIGVAGGPMIPRGRRVVVRSRGGRGRSPPA